jgi:hypothetical protein
MSDLRSSYLIQRLDPPFSMGEVKDNPFSFGGGLVNGGLAPEAMDLLRGLFSFDYMGAAEFEWGAVPKALDRIARNADLAAWSFDLPLAAVAKGWQDKTKTEPEGTVTVYVIADRQWADEVERRIKGWAGEAYNSGLKESTHLASVLRPSGNYTPRTAGWLELDNGFLFFIDREMWEGTARLFGVEAGVKP